MELLHRDAATISRALVAEHDPIADAEAMEQLADQLQQRISPLVAIEPHRKRALAGQTLPDPETLFCDLAGITHLFDDEAGVLAEAHRCLNEFGYTAKLAIADNAAAAWAHAHYNTKNDFIATDNLNDLQSLHVCALRLETETYHTISRLGIETIGSLLRLPRGGLARRLGADLVRRIAEVLGEIEVPLDAYHPEPEHHCRQELEYPTDDLQIIAHRITLLSEQIVAGLAGSDRGVLRVLCQLNLTERAPLTTTIGLFAPTLDVQHLGGLIHSSIESLRIPSAVKSIELGVVQSGPLRTQQQSLFAEDAFSVDGDSVAQQSLARLDDSLSIRLGRQAVLGVRLTDNPLPEKAYRTYSLTDHRTRKSLRRLPAKARPPRRAESRPAESRPTSFRQPNGHHAFRSPGRQDARRRPLKLLRKPVPLLVAEVSRSSRSDQRDALPAFRANNRLHRVVFHWGPERIETAWWDGPSVRRDYFRIETDSGHLWWVFQDLKSGQWFLHGRFS